ncbi:hypothetical protein D9M71_270440 [compost metagenome]
MGDDRGHATGQFADQLEIAAGIVGALVVEQYLGVFRITANGCQWLIEFMADARRHGAQCRQFAGLDQIVLGADQLLLGLLAFQYFLFQAPVQAFEIAGALGDPTFQFAAGLGFESNAIQVMAAALHHQAKQQHHHQQRCTADGHHRAHRTVDQGARGEDADIPAGFGDLLGLGQPGVGVELQRFGIAGWIGLDRSDGFAFGLAQRTGRAESPLRSRGENDHPVVVGQQQLFRGFAPEAFGVVEVDLDHQHPYDFFAIAYAGGEEVTALGGGGTQTKEAPEPPGHGFAEIRPEGKIAPDKAVVLVPVGGGQRLAGGVHQVHDFGTGLGGDIFQQAVGIALGDAIVRCTDNSAQGRQVTEDLRQHFIAVQGAQQVGDIEVEGLTILAGQFAAVIALGQVLQRPQQWRQAQCQQGQAAPTGSGGESWFHEQHAPMGTGALCLGLPALGQLHLERRVSAGLSGKDVGVLEKHAGLIFSRQLRCAFELPVDGQVRVVPANAAFGRWRVVVGGFVQELGKFAEYDKPVGKAFRDPELPMIGGGQPHGDPFAEVRRAATDVHGDVQHFTDGDADQFALGIFQLVMQAAQHTLLRTGVIVLNELSVHPGGLFEGPGVETLVEETTLVTKDLGFEDQNTGQVGGHYVHGGLSSCMRLMAAILAQSAIRGECQNQNLWERACSGRRSDEGGVTGNLNVTDTPSSRASPLPQMPS